MGLIGTSRTFAIERHDLQWPWVTFKGHISCWKPDIAWKWLNILFETEPAEGHLYPPPVGALQVLGDLMPSMCTEINVKYLHTIIGVMQLKIIFEHKKIVNYFVYPNIWLQSVHDLASLLIFLMYLDFYTVLLPSFIPVSGNLAENCKHLFSLEY